MGGSGSGNRYRWNKQTTLDDVKRIDIRYMKSGGCSKKIGAAASAGRVVANLAAALTTAAM